MLKCEISSDMVLLYREHHSQRSTRESLVVSQVTHQMKWAQVKALCIYKTPVNNCIKD